MQIASSLSYSVPQPTTLSIARNGEGATVSSENSGSVFQPVDESKSTSSTSLPPNSAEPPEASGSNDSPEAENSNSDEEITEQEQQQILELSARDTEVRNHERAHAAVGGQYAGAPEYQYERGPDGINYAVSGEVSISTSKIPGDPQATIEKAQVVRRAALAPAEPSTQDRRVAALATQMEMEARVELNQQRQEAAVEDTEESSASSDESEVSDTSPNAAETANSSFFRSESNSLPSDTNFNSAIDSTRRLLSSSYNPDPQSIGHIFSRYA